MNENKGYIDQIIANLILAGFPGSPQFQPDYGYCLDLLCREFPQVRNIVTIFVGYLTVDDLNAFAKSDNPFETLVMAFYRFVESWFGERL